MVISLQKTIPNSSSFNAYTSGGDTTITLKGVTNITFHSKKDMINLKIPKSKKTQADSPVDKYSAYVVDLVRGTDEIKIRGWLEDDSSTSAWEKAWKIRAMCVRGGPLTNLTIDNIEFKSDTQQAFLEDVVIPVNPDDSGALNVNKGDDRARIEIELTFLIGDER